MVANERINNNLTDYSMKGYMTLYTLSIVLYTPLSIYSSGIASFLLADFFIYFVTLILFFAVMRKNGDVSPFYMLLVPMSYVVLITLLFALDDVPILLRTARFLYNLFFVFIFARKFFSISIAMSIYKVAVVFATIFLLVQFFLYYFFNYYLPGYLPFLNIAREELVLYSSNIYGAVNQRMRSIFSEPAHYAAYSAFFMYLTLIKNGIKKSNWKDLLLCAFISLGIILSSSTTGIVLAFLGWVLFVFLKMGKGKINLKYSMFFPFALLVFFFVYQSDVVQNSILRMTLNSSQESRLISIFDVFDYSANPLAFFFGHGMDLQEIYLASYGRMVFYFGVIGTTLFVCVFLFYALKNIYSFFVLCYILVMGVGTSLWLSGNFMLYLCFLLLFSMMSKGYYEKESNP